MFLTYDDPRQAAAQAEQLVAMRQAAQQLRVVEDWQPKLNRLLTRLPGECLEAILREALEQAGRPPDQADREAYEYVLDIIHHFIANVDLPQGQAILEEMVRAEGQALAEIIAFHGLLGETPDTTDWPGQAGPWPGPGRGGGALLGGVPRTRGPGTGRGRGHGPAPLGPAAGAPHPMVDQPAGGHRRHPDPRGHQPPAQRDGRRTA